MLSHCFDTDLESRVTAQERYSSVDGRRRRLRDRQSDQLVSLGETRGPDSTGSPSGSTDETSLRSGNGFLPPPTLTGTPQPNYHQRELRHIIDIMITTWSRHPTTSKRYPVCPFFPEDLEIPYRHLILSVRKQGLTYNTLRSSGL